MYCYVSVCLQVNVTGIFIFHFACCWRVNVEGIVLCFSLLTVIFMFHLAYMDVSLIYQSQNLSTHTYK